MGRVTPHEYECCRLYLSPPPNRDRNRSNFVLCSPSNFASVDHPRLYSLAPNPAKAACCAGRTRRGRICPCSSTQHDVGRSQSHRGSLTRCESTEDASPRWTFVSMSPDVAESVLPWTKEPTRHPARAKSDQWRSPLRVRHTRYLPINVNLDHGLGPRRGW